MPELPEAVQQIPLAALRRSPKDRPACLDSARGSDAGLRARIESAPGGIGIVPDFDLIAPIGHVGLD